MFTHNWINIKAKKLQREDGTLIADVAMRNMALDTQNSSLGAVLRCSAASCLHFTSAEVAGALLASQRGIDVLI